MSRNTKGNADDEARGGGLEPYPFVICLSRLTFGGRGCGEFL